MLADWGININFTTLLWRIARQLRGIALVPMALDTNILTRDISQYVCNKIYSYAYRIWKKYIFIK